MLASVAEEVGEVSREINGLEGCKKRKASEKKADLKLEIRAKLFRHLDHSRGKGS